MQNTILKFRQISCISEKPSYLPEKLKTLASSNLRRIQYFLVQFCKRCRLTNAYKRVLGIFFLFSQILSYLELFQQIIQDLNKILKNPTPPCVDIGKQRTSAKFEVKLLKSTVVGARQSFQFFRENTGFLEINRAQSKFLYEILYYLISITKL